MKKKRRRRPADRLDMALSAMVTQAVRAQRPTSRKPPDHSSPNPEYMTRREVAEKLGFRDPDTASRLMKLCPDFPRPFRPLHPQGHPRWRRTAIEAWIQANYPGEVRA